MADEGNRRRNHGLRMLLAGAGEGLLVIGADAVVRLMNETAEEMFGVKRAEAVGSEVEVLGSREIAGSVRKGLEAGKGGRARSVRTEVGSRHLTCMVRPFEGVPVEGDEGDEAEDGVAITIRDDTELVECRERAEAVLASTGDGLIVLDADGTVGYANPAAVSMLGAKVKRAVGRQVPFATLLGEEGEDPTEAARCGERTVREIVVEKPEHRVIEVRTNPVKGRHDEYLGCAISLHDVTAEREIAQMKNEFVSTVSHELRTPLTSIKGYVDLILDGEAGEINEIQQEFLSIVQENSDRLVALINDMLDISRIESGRIRLKREPLQLVDVALGAVETFRTLAEGAGIELVVKLPEDLPKAAGDRDRIGQVMMNLISNAIKYSPGGGTVTVRVRKDRDRIITSVTDTGIGISKKDQKKLFSKFYRVDSSLTREIGGTGLGLSICKSIVELQGGRIWARSEEGEGSTFSFALPIAPAELIRTPYLQGPLEGGGTVLVVDRSPEVADLVEKYLRKRGYEVIKAYSGAEAMRQAREHRPDVITLDVILDDVDGFDLLGRLKDDESTADIPVVVLSIVCDEGKSCRLGAAEYLEKPIQSDRLVQVVNSLVGKVSSPLALIVDDDRAIVDVLAKTLRGKGFAVQCAYDGAEAMQAVKAQKPDVMLLDLKMPVKDGYQVIQEVKSAEETRGIPIVVMTAHRIDRERIDILAQASEQIHKPFDAAAIAERVEEVLTKRAEGAA
ncbi:MAG: response regulator [Coriobacteriia bacterium]|nr:response regulator [Coriobacteriia bacterium]